MYNSCRGTQIFVVVVFADGGSAAAAAAAAAVVCSFVGDVSYSLGTDMRTFYDQNGHVTTVGATAPPPPPARALHYLVHHLLALRQLPLVDATSFLPSAGEEGVREGPKDRPGVPGRYPCPRGVAHGGQGVRHLHRPVSERVFGLLGSRKRWASWWNLDIFFRVVAARGKTTEGSDAISTALDALVH